LITIKKRISTTHDDTKLSICKKKPSG